ncbi:MAG TPA: ATP-binding protein [Nitrososphaera sp.]
MRSLRPGPERTEIFQGAEDTTCALVFFFTNASIVSACTDPNALSIAMEAEPVKKCFEDLKKRRAKVRWITEITRENLPNCRSLLKYEVEVRHLDGMKGIFAVTDSAYIAADVVNKAQPVPELIYSSARSIVEQNKHIFDTLWSKAILTEDRIREIEEGGIKPETRAAKDPNEILQNTIGMLRRSNQYSVCSASDGLLYAYNNAFDSFKDILNQGRYGKHRGIRWVTSIDDNYDSRLFETVRAFVNLGMQIRHVRSIPPMSFGVSEKEIGVTIESMRGGSLNASAIFSSERPFVEQFATIFENVWNNGIDVQLRIDEIKEQKEAFIDVIQNPIEIQKRYRALVSSAKQQVLLFLPTTTAYRREEKIGIFESLEKAAAVGVDIRILIPTEEGGEQEIQRKVKSRKGFKIRRIKTNIPTEARSKILIVDRREYLMIELKDNTKETFVEAVGSAIFSNSRPTILSYVTMFDSLWGQTDLYEKLEVHDRMQKEFINIAAHELRTPVQSILGYSELLQGNPKEDTEFMLKSLTRNAYRLQTLINDILDVARIEAGTLILDRENLNLTDLIETVMSDIENQVNSSGKKVQFSYPRKQMPLQQQQQLSSSEINDLIVDADRDRILQVLSNLLNNAIKFTSEGKIAITLEREGNQVIVKVRDSGSGIDSEIYPKLFEKFASKSEKGTGLGLFISKNIIQAHNGKIWAENNPGGIGATFSFSLPVAEPSLSFVQEQNSVPSMSLKD